MPTTILRRPQVFAQIRKLPDRVRVGVAVKGYAASYALVWEWGTLRFPAPGPKTTWGENPDAGQTKIFTKTAPSGYIRIHRQQYFEMLRAAVTAISTQQELNRGSYAAELLSNMEKMATEAAQLMSKDAPIDTGLLRASIFMVSADEVDRLLQGSYRPLLIGDSSDA